MSYWILWPLGIVAWLALGWWEFGLLERNGLKPTRPNQITLSMWCYTIISKFPLSLFLGGLIVGLFWGILMTHLAWHWCPPGSVSAG